jgi:hypothetical protein
MARLKGHYSRLSCSVFVYEGRGGNMLLGEAAMLAVHPSAQMAVRIFQVAMPRSRRTTRFDLLAVGCDPKAVRCSRETFPFGSVGWGRRT